MRMAQAGARGAAHSAFLVMETVTGLGASSGYEGAAWEACMRVWGGCEW